MPDPAQNCSVCGDPGACPPNVCLDGACTPSACQWQVDGEMAGCPGTTVEKRLIVGCSPAECPGAVSLTGRELPPGWSVTGGGACSGGSGEGTVRVAIPADAEGGWQALGVTVFCNGRGCRQESLTVTVVAPDLEFDGVPESEDLDPGGFVGLNNDDDDTNGLPDLQQGQPVDREDDLCKVTLHVAGYDPAATVRLYQSLGSDKIKVYEGSPGSLTEITNWPRIWGPGTFIDGTEVRVEGVATSTGPRDVDMELRYCPPGGGVCVDQIKMTVVEVQTIEWYEFAAYSTPLDTCPNNGGVRIFPDARYVIDTFRNDRPKVDLVATVRPVVEGCPVQLRTWDVDDPFDQNHPTLPNVAVIDADASGPDNRGPDPGVGQWSVVTDANGQARQTVTMSMQPGNNYRAAASILEDGVADVTQAQIDANTAPPQAKFSDMLTVWRHVWLELDSMALGKDISYTGMIDEITDNSPHAGDGTVELRVPDIDDNGRFEGGIMAVPATGSSYTIIDNVDVTGDDDYTMGTLVAAGDYGQSANVVDDDTAVLPKTPDANQSVLNAKYKNCYIEFAENSATRSLDNGFVATLPWDPAVVADKGLENAHLTPALDRWLVIVVECYQAYDQFDDAALSMSSADADPDVVYHVHGASSSAGDAGVVVGIAPLAGTNVVMFFLEGAEDQASQVPVRTLAYTEPRVIAHEIGHTFGLPDIPNGATLMTSVGPPETEFDGGEIAAVRGSTNLAVH